MNKKMIHSTNYTTNALIKGSTIKSSNQESSFRTNQLANPALNKNIKPLPPVHGLLADRQQQKFIERSNRNVHVRSNELGKVE